MKNNSDSSRTTFLEWGNCHFHSYCCSICDNPENSFIQLNRNTYAKLLSIKAVANVLVLS